MVFRFLKFVAGKDPGEANYPFLVMQGLHPSIILPYGFLVVGYIYSFCDWIFIPWDPFSQ